MKSFWKEAWFELKAGRRIYCILVASAKKGSPGTSAARMFVREDGSQCGTIGGGIMERRALDHAVAFLGSGQSHAPELLVLEHKRTGEDQSSGLICGGEQTNIRFTLSNAADVDVVEKLARAEEEESGIVLVITKGGISIEEKQVDFRSDFCAGNDWCYRYNFVNQRRIAIFGGGHCGVELARTMDGLGYAVTVVDPRQDLFTLDALPDSVNRIDTGFSDAAKCVLHPEKTLAAVMTYSMPTDIEALSGILNFAFPFIGVMGSSPKIVRIRKSLAEMGFGDLQLGRLRAPIGLSFNSDTPQEIAVSIAAQILLERESQNAHG